MADERFQKARREISEIYPNLYEGVALKRAIELMQAAALADLADAVTKQTLLLEREAARQGNIKVGL